MTKREELRSPDSCLTKANPGEMLFVLLGRDEAAPIAIRAWIAERIRIGKNKPGDAKLEEAERAARVMETARTNGREEPGQTEDQEMHELEDEYKWDMDDGPWDGPANKTR